jgi:hypothetical protein
VWCRYRASQQIENRLPGDEGQEEDDQQKE